MRFAGSLSDKEREKALFEVVGVPFDGNAVKKGAAKAPGAVRKASHSLETFLWHRKREISDMRFYDAGDISLKRTGIMALKESVNRNGKSDTGKHAESGELFRVCGGTDRRTIFIGGDHSVSVALVRALCERYHLKVFIMDAHADLREKYRGNIYSNACAARRIAEIVGIENVVLIGVRSASADEYDFIRENGVRVYDAEEITTDLKGVLSDINEMGEDECVHCGNTASYISVDIDVLDPSIAPGVEYPEPCGLSMQHVISILSDIIRKKNVVAADVVEVNPRKDTTGTTSICAARIVMEILAGLHDACHDACEKDACVRDACVRDACVRHQEVHGR